MKQYRERLLWLLNRSQTSAVRLWFAVASLGYAAFFFFTPAKVLASGDLHYAMQLAPCWVYMWLFMVHGLTLLYGVMTRKFSPTLYWLEGVFGTMLWTSVEASTWLYNGYPDAALAGVLVAWWIQYRYPGMSERTDEL